MNEEHIFEKRILELAQKAYRENCYQYTGFLNLMEQSEVERCYQEISYAGVQSFGGNPLCERKIYCFGSVENFGYEPVYPLVCIHIYPSSSKFAEKLGHRDYLGAIMNLGIKRSFIGDIFVKEKEAWVFVLEGMSDYFMNNLGKVKNTLVKTEICEQLPEDVAPKMVKKQTNVASERLDAVISGVYHLSRSQVIELFREKRVFLDGRLMENKSGTAKAGTIVSVRHHGRFLYDGVVSETKKGRRVVAYRIFET